MNVLLADFYVLDGCQQGLPPRVPDLFRQSARMVCTSLSWCTNTWYVSAYQCLGEEEKKVEEEGLVEE